MFSKVAHARRPREGRREAKTVEALEILNELQNVKRANGSVGVLRTKLRLLCEAVRTAGKWKGKGGEKRTRDGEWQKKNEVAGPERESPGALPRDHTQKDRAEGEGKWIVFFAEWVMLEVGQGGAGDGDGDVDEREGAFKTT